MSRLAAVVVLVLASGSVLGQETNVTIQFVPPPASTLPIVVHAKAVDARQAPVRLETRVEAGGRSATVSVPGEGSWIVSLEAPGFWAAPVRIAGGLASEVRALRTGFVSGKLAAEVKAPISLRLEEVPGTEEPPTKEMFPCVREVELAFRCELPAGRWAFSMRLAEHAPVYVFDKAVEGGRVTDVGLVSFQPGASVSGFVKSEAGRLDPDKATVLGRPEATKEAARPIRIAANGFFQASPVPPGTYLLLASQSGLAPDRRRVEIRPGLEARLDQPLLLSIARRLELTVVPPAGPDGRPWRVDTIEVPAEGRSEIRSAPPLVGGFLSWNGLGKGRRYRIRLLTDAGVPWYVDEQPFVADEPVIQRSIELGSERTRGVVLQGKSPLKNAVLTFGGKNEEVQVRLLADADGRFEGLLPRMGEWKVHVSATDPYVGREVKASVVRAADGYGDVEVRVDDIAVRGEVVDEDGTLYERQVILRIRETSAIGRPYYSDHVVQGGRFVVAGLPNGSFSANADLPDLVSDDVKFEVSADEETSPLTVILRPKKGMRLRVLSPAGKGLGGLRVLVLPSPSNPDSFAEGMQTDLDGRAYKAVSPSDSTRCVLLVGSDFGLPTTFGTVLVDGKETTHTLSASGGTLDLAAFEQAPWVGSGGCWMNVVHLRRTVNVRSPASKTVYLSPGEYRLWTSRPASWQSPSQWSGYLKPGETLSPAAN